MAEKLVPDLQVFADELKAELKLSAREQRLLLARQMLNVSPELLPEIHLEEWYHHYWRMANVFQQVKLTESESALCEEVIAKTVAFDEARKQFAALILIMFGKLKDAQPLMNQKLWSKHLRDDFETFTKWNALGNTDLDLTAKASIRRTRQIKKFLADKYSHLIDKYRAFEVNSKTCPKVAPKDYRIYFCWLQGEANLPPLIRCCYNSLKLNAGRYEILFIDGENYSEYVNLPDYIVDKFKAGKIGPAHFSDVIRINLLERYGGLWLDSTILVTEPLEKHKNLLRLPFFTQKYIHEKDNNYPITRGFKSYTAYGRWAGFIQGTSILHNPLFAFEKDFFNEYWRDFDEAIDYVLMDYMMDIAWDNIPFVRREIDDVPINNTNVWTLKNYLNESYAKFPFDRILKDNFLNKFSRRIPMDMDNPNTVFREIQRRYAPETI